MFSLAKLPFSEQEVRDYERRRYRGLDQRLVHRREVRILQKIMRLIEEENKGAHRVYPTVDLTTRLTARPAKRLALDAPCGYGRFSALLLDKAYNLVSADLSLAMVERARRREDISTIPMGIVCDLIRGLPFQPGVFSVILSMRLFHHLHQPMERRSVLEELARVASGWVILSYYQANVLHGLQRRLRRLVKKSRTRICMIRGREFREEVRAARLEIVRVFPLFRGIHAHHIALLKKA